MIDLKVLYMVSVLVVDYTSDSGVGRTTLARYMSCSTNTIKTRCDALISAGLIRERRVPQLRGKGFMYLYNLTSQGLERLESEFDRIKEQYDAWRIVLQLEAIEKMMSTKVKPKLKKQLAAEKAGQKVLFYDE